MFINTSNIDMREIGEVDVTWFGTIGNYKGGGCIWGGVAGCWCCLLMSSIIVISSMFTVCFFY